MLSGLREFLGNCSGLTFTRWTLIRSALAYRCNPLYAYVATTVPHNCLKFFAYVAPGISRRSLDVRFVSASLLRRIVLDGIGH